MQLASFDSLLRRTLSRLGEDYDGVAGAGTTGPDAQRWRDVRDSVSEALEAWWLQAWWPALCRVEHRPLRAPYDAGTTYDTGTEVWHEPSRRYYLAIADAPTDEPPASWSVDQWEANDAFWAECKRLYGANEYDASTDYLPGDQVWYPSTSRFYQCHTAVTGEAPPDTDYWGLLVEFVPTLDRVQEGYANIGHVRGLYANDPRVYPETETLDYDEVEDGWQVLTDGHPWPWVVYRLRCPRLEGLAYDARATYTPTDDEGEGVVLYTTEMSSSRGIPGRTSLRAVTSHRDRQMAYLLYLTSEDDGQGGEWVYRATSTDADDGVSVLKPDNIDAADPGRWHVLVNPS